MEVKTALDNLQQLFNCTICLSPLSNPTSIQCGHIFCALCVSKLQKSRDAASATCPLCKAKVSRRALKTRKDVADLSSAVHILKRNLEAEASNEKLPVVTRARPTLRNKGEKSRLDSKLAVPTVTAQDLPVPTSSKSLRSEIDASKVKNGPVYDIESDFKADSSKPPKPSAPSPFKDPYHFSPSQRKSLLANRKSKRPSKGKPSKARGPPGVNALIVGSRFRISSSSLNTETPKMQRGSRSISARKKKSQVKAASLNSSGDSSSSSESSTKSPPRSTKNKLTKLSPEKNMEITEDVIVSKSPTPSEIVAEPKVVNEAPMECDSSPPCVDHVAEESRISISNDSSMGNLGGKTKKSEESVISDFDANSHNSKEVSFQAPTRTEEHAEVDNLSLVVKSCPKTALNKMLSTVKLLPNVKEHVETQSTPLDLSFKGDRGLFACLTPKSRLAFKFVKALDLSVKKSSDDAVVKKRFVRINNPAILGCRFSTVTKFSPPGNFVSRLMKTTFSHEHPGSLESSAILQPLQRERSVERGRVDASEVFSAHVSQEERIQAGKDAEIECLDESLFQASCDKAEASSPNMSKKRHLTPVFEKEVEQEEKRTKLSDSFIPTDSDVVFIEDNFTKPDTEAPEVLDEIPVNSLDAAAPLQSNEDTCFSDDNHEEKEKIPEVVADSESESECSFLAATPTTHKPLNNRRSSARFSRRLSYEIEPIVENTKGEGELKGKETEGSKSLQEQHCASKEPSKVVHNFPVDDVGDINYDTCPVRRQILNVEAKKDTENDSKPSVAEKVKAQTANYNGQIENDPMDVDEDYENANEYEEDIQEEVANKRTINEKGTQNEEPEQFEIQTDKSMDVIPVSESSNTDQKKNLLNKQNQLSLNNSNNSHFCSSREDEFNRLEQEYLNVFKKPSDTPRRKFVFCPTRLTKAQLTKLNSLCQMCDGTISKDYTEEVTHLVINLEKSRVPQTIKYLFAIADKKWVVIFDWVEECLKQGVMAYEEPYETSSFPDCDSGVGKSRKTKHSLFQGMCVYFATNLKNSGASIEDCKKLVEKLGGKIILNPYAASDNVLIIGDATCLHNAYQEWYRTKGWLTVSWEWVLDCVLSYYLIPFSSAHLLTNVGSLGVQRACLPKALLDENQPSPLNLLQNFR